MATLQITTYNDIRNDHESNKLEKLISSHLSSMEATISMMEVNLNNMIRERISKAEYENSMITYISWIRGEISVLKNTEINIQTTTVTTVEVK